MYRKYIKRIIDIALSLVGIIIATPFFLVIAIFIKLDSPGKVIFKQKRSGFHRKHFYMYKFRTMRVETPKNTPTGELENAEHWITKPGRILRKTSLDEIPQLLNILKGEMSFIGPRPVVVEEVDLIDERDKYGANDVLPGITGWAQVNGRDTIGFKKKAQLDGEYVEKMSALFDFKCFILTFVNVLVADGIVEGKMNSKEVKK